jgi:sigma-B regulation protein RsbU (phosphoserine phosphatase)
MIPEGARQEMKILLVDDDTVARSLLSLLLQQQGHEVVEATDGQHAWDLLQREEITFVLSDWLMPNLAGVDLCRKIRGVCLDRYIYVILCTSKGAKSDLIEGMDAGADDFLVKPISPEELRVKVRAGERVLSLQQGLADKNRELASINSRLHSAQQMIEDDLRAAAWMQRRLLPSPALLANGIRCAWRLQPSGYVAGDTFNFFAMGEQQVGFYLLDVSGHGVPAAMLSVTLSMMLTPDAASGNPLKRYNRDREAFELLSPGEAIRVLNQRFQSKDDSYFTMIYGLFDTGLSTLSLAQAGHPGPILIKKAGEVTVLGSGGMPVGVCPDIEFDCFDISADHGDRLLLYSDGVTECMNLEGEAFGENRLLAYLEQWAAEPLDELLGGLLTEIKTWRVIPDFGDDVSLLAIEMAP